MQPEPSTAPPIPSPATSQVSPNRSTLPSLLSALALVVAILALILSLTLPGPAGPAGAGYTVGTVLQHGQNETGVYSAWGGGAGYLGTQVNFRIPLAADLPASNVTFVAYGGSYTTSCPGPGNASEGQLCVYEAQAGGQSFGRIDDPFTGLQGASRWGFQMYFDVTSSTGSWSYGSWTVGAP